MALFEPAVELVLAHEGGYSADIADPGGETNFGISKRAYPNEDIKNMTRERAMFLYHRDYWNPGMEALTNQRLANCALDCAVNQGPEVAKTFLNTLFLTTNISKLATIQHLRIMRYCDTAFKNTALRKDLNGWIRRTLDVGE